MTAPPALPGPVLTRLPPPFPSYLPFPSTVRNGHIKRITDGDIQSSVLEIMGTNVSTIYITCPAEVSRGALFWAVVAPVT